MGDIQDFFTSQLKEWPLARKNYNNLDNVQYRKIGFNNFNILIQFNPDRIISTVANIDKEALKQRKCFLCYENMPTEQKSFYYSNKFDIRVNPYPIYNNHFTVPSKLHTPQLIDDNFEDILNIAKDLPEYTVFYNGPESGASAPDHFHFQLVPGNNMPLESDIKHGPKELIYKKENLIITSIENYIRHNIIIQSSDYLELVNIFYTLNNLLLKIIPSNYPEAMMNLFAWYDNTEWTVVLFPRRKHRPHQFFATGDDNILFSPGCVDFAGMVVCPREKDFYRYDKELLEDLFGQLTVDEEQWIAIKKIFTYI